MAKILIVDDSKIFRKMLKSTLIEHGHEIVGEASNGKEALELLSTSHPDLVTLDITMPIMDGIETLTHIKENNPQLNVIMVSAAGQKAKVMSALKLGACDFLQKPFQPDEVITTVNKYI